MQKFKIDQYSFGNMIISNERFTSDLIIFPDKILENWWRKEGHSLHPEDLKDVIEYKPKLLIVGTGKYGSMKIP
ncbi:MAG: MTH938/NDUFAF3 family protein, partial [Methanosarcinales archaeon]